MGKETSAKINETQEGVSRAAPKIVKLKFQVDKLKTHAKNEHGKQNGHRGEAAQGGPKSLISLGEKQLRLSAPEHHYRSEDLSLGALDSNLSSSMVDKPFLQQRALNDIRQVAQGDLLNLNETELKYLKTVVIDKYKDENRDKLQRSKRRYGW